MNIPKTQFFRMFGNGNPNEQFDLDAMQYGQVDDRRALLALARKTQPKTVIEFGVCDGLTAQMLLAEVPSIETYIGIDLPRAKKEQPALEGQLPEKPAAAGALVKEDPRVTILRKRSETLTPDDLPGADLIYVDGGHDYATAMHDSVLAHAKVNPGGVIVWHDYDNGTVEINRVIDELNQAGGDHICLVDGTWVCFEFHRGED